MDFRTLVDLPAGAPSLSLRSRVMALGSCFASHMGARLRDALPEGRVEVNPFGAVYNPMSMYAELRALEAGTLRADGLLFRGRDGLWHSWAHSGEFSAGTREGCLDNVMARFGAAVEAFGGTDVICLTWATAHYYCLRGDDGDGAEGADGDVPARLTGNCHKEEGRRFDARRVDVEGTVRRYADVLARLKARRPGLQVVVTVSPYRYAKLGFHGNTVSKAILHLAAEGLAEELDYVHYFPAYEILLDELRDYRFYDRDMLHPSEVATDYVWERFRGWCFTPELRAFADEKAALLRDLRHRPLHRDGAEYGKFAARLDARLRAFREKWGGHGVPEEGHGFPPCGRNGNNKGVVMT